MITCPFCQATHVRNTIFCSECGQYLLDEDIRETDTDMTGRLADQIRKPGTGSLVHPGKPRAIRLKIGSGARAVEVPLDKIIHLGRVSPTTSTFPEVDLSRDGNPAKSVSRRHARILRRGGRVVVEDLDSANGTFVNGEKLGPYLPEPLNDGDILRLGKLIIEVNIVNARL